jgi:hypothetical protein
VYPSRPTSSDKLESERLRALVPTNFIRQTRVGEVACTRPNQLHPTNLCRRGCAHSSQPTSPDGPDDKFESERLRALVPTNFTRRTCVGKVACTSLEQLSLAYWNSPERSWTLMKLCQNNAKTKHNDDAAERSEAAKEKNGLFCEYE